METLLFAAVCGKRYKLARILVEGGIDANCTNEDGETPLLMVCNEKTNGNQRRMKIELIRTLMDNNANYLNRDNYGRSSLTCAHINRDLQVIKILQEIGQGQWAS